MIYNNEQLLTTRHNQIKDVFLIYLKSIKGEFFKFRRNRIPNFDTLETITSLTAYC